MTRYVAFLRAVNVAGHGRAKMNDVRDVFAGAGGQNVATVMQSGNVLFEALSRDVSIVLRYARQELKKLLDEEPKIMLRPLRRLVNLVNNCPFQNGSAASKRKFYVVFLSRRPRRNVEFPLVSPAEGLEAIGFDEHEVFVVSRPKKSGFYGFPNNFIEKELGVEATSRNWSTIAKIVKHDAH